jgi:AraC family transcriptional regulator, transcriptional activator FtrA
MSAVAPKNRKVAAVIYDGLCTFEFAIVAEVFALPRPELKVDWYKFSVCSADRVSSRATGGVRVVAPKGLAPLRGAGTIVIPGWKNADVDPPPDLVRALRHAHDRGARLMSICSGVFVLAATGLLDGKRVTTHWRYIEKLRARYPAIHVEPDVLYVDEGDILTSAGSAAGIDLCLHLVRRDYGAAVVNEVARRMVVPPHRDGGQAQYVQVPVPHETEDGLAQVMEWASRRLNSPLAVGRLAAQAGMSARTFARRFVEQTGTTPHRWLTQQRLFAAQRLLETTTQAIDRIAESVGFDTAETLRHHFRRHFGTTPTQYRRRFSMR